MSGIPVKTIFYRGDYAFPESPSPLLRQQIDTGNGFFELCCQYLHRSYSSFPETIRYYHSSPLISRLILVERGSVNLEFKDRSLEVASGNIYLLPSGHPFHAEYREGTVTKGFHLYLRDHLRFTIGSELPDVLMLNCPELFNAMSFAVKDDHPALIHACMMTILIQMLKAIIPLMEKRDKIPGAYQKIIDELKENPSSAVNCSAYARKLHISLPSLSKNFRRFTGVPLKKYQQQQILEKACRLLIETDMTANEIAAELNYSDLNYFFVFFKKHMGQTPLEFRHGYGQSLGLRRCYKQ
ncbi:MAG: AraC family transcriptional regulator [Victivallales bacterium]|nr:AraC family transcriptional regulator [Victivallales bacterium]